MAKVVIFLNDNKTIEVFLSDRYINSTAVEVILVPLVILTWLPPLNRLGSHKQETTDIGAGDNFGNNRT